MFLGVFGRFEILGGLRNGLKSVGGVWDVRCGVSQGGASDFVLCGVVPEKKSKAKALQILHRSKTNPARRKRTKES